MEWATGFALCSAAALSSPHFRCTGLLNAGVGYISRVFILADLR